MFWWKSKKQKDNERKEEERRRKIAASQLALLEAATTTADAAHHVTTQLKKHLENSIKQFETTMKIISDGLIICDANGIIKTLNPAAKHIFACSDICGENINILFNLPNDDIWNSLNEITEGQRQNKESFPVDIKIEKMSKADESVIYLILVRDISNINEIQKTSKEFEQRYRILFDQCIDGILILQNNKIMALNESAQKLLKNKNVETVRIPYGHTIELNEIEKEYILSGANISWNGMPASLITIKENGNKPLEPKHRDTCVDMIVCFDKNYLITFVNEQFCNYYNKNRLEIIGKDIRLILSETELATFLLSINSLTETNPMKRVQVHVEHNKNKVLQDWVDYVSFENGEIIEYQRTGRDITEALRTLDR